MKHFFGKWNVLLCRANVKQYDKQKSFWYLKVQSFNCVLISLLSRVTALPGKKKKSIAAVCLSSLFPGPMKHSLPLTQLIRSLLLRNDLAASWVAARRRVALEWSPTLPDCRRLPSHISSKISGHNPQIMCPAERTSMRKKKKKKKTQNKEWPPVASLLLEGYLLAGRIPGCLAKSHESCKAKACT